MWNKIYDFLNCLCGLPRWHSGEKKNLPANAGEVGSISGSGRFPEIGNGNLLQYSCLENSMDRGAWRLQSIGLQRVGYDWETKNLRIRISNILCYHTQKSLWPILSLASSLIFLNPAKASCSYSLWYFLSCVCVGRPRCSVMSDSLWFHGLQKQPARLLCPEDFPRKKYWNGFLFLPPWNFPNPAVKCLSPVAPAILYQ